MRKIIVAALIAGFGFAPGAAKEAEAPFIAPQTIEELDARIAETLKDSNVVGLQAALVDGTGAYWAKGYGHLDKEKTRPAGNGSIFRAGSISKSFVGVLAEMLAEDGVLDLNERLSDAAPEIEFTNKWEETDPVRLVHLSEHTTGWDDVQFSEYRDFGPDVTLLEGLAVNPVSRTSRWRPGRYPSYCNAGPVVLAAVIEKKTGRRFEDLIDERIFAPLGIEGASYLLTEEVAARLSKSYSGDQREEPYTHIGLRPSGSLNISASELAKFVAFLIRRGEAGGDALVSPGGVERIETATTSLAARAGLKVGYGLGVASTLFDGRMFYGHSGGIDAFIAHYGYSHETKTGFVVMMNTAAGEPFFAIRRLIAAYLAAQAPTRASAEAAGDVDLARYEGRYRALTPRNGFSQFLSDVVDVVNLRAEDGRLTVAPLLGERESLRPLGDGLFADGDDDDEAQRIFLTTPEGAMEMHLSFQAAYRRVSDFDAYWRAGLFALIGLAGAAAAATTLIWIVARPFGAFRGAHRWRVWAWPLLGYASIALMAAAFATGAAGSFSVFMARLGGPSLWSWSIYAGSWGVPLFGVLGLAGALTAPGDTSRFARLHAGATSALLIALGFYLWTYGWLGMTIWSYRPSVFGI